MVISKLNLNKIKENLNLIGEFLEKLKRLQKLARDELCDILQNDLSDIEIFLREMEMFLRKYKGQTKD